uniref:uncharacterized protein LOC118146429 isoform X1 n=1 Tax=Callithrix jacchus TaxID=9483 RepID=UPI00159D3569|nr:uncharacterized protein LOC118146429 isoform X1 [Callithrix jacchus]
MAMFCKGGGVRNKRVKSQDLATGWEEAPTGRSTHRKEHPQEGAPSGRSTCRKEHPQEGAPAGRSILRKEHLQEGAPSGRSTCRKEHPQEGAPAGRSILRKEHSQKGTPSGKSTGRKENSQEKAPARRSPQRNYQISKDGETSVGSTTAKGQGHLPEEGGNRSRPPWAWAGSVALPAENLKQHRADRRPPAFDRHHALPILNNVSDKAFLSAWASLARNPLPHSPRCFCIN